MKNLPWSVWRLTVAFAFMMAGTSMIVLIAGIIGTEIAPSADLATLPIALAIVGVASSTLPTGKLLGLFGRRRIFLSYGLLAIVGASLAALSLIGHSFAGFCGAAFMIGWCAAAGHQYRFAALEAVPILMAPKATSALLLGGLLGVFIGPELAVRGRWLVSTEYAGSFLLLVASYVVGLCFLSFYQNAQTSESQHQGRGRPLGIIFRSPLVIFAVCTAALAYGLMSFIMTATPISMHQHSGHSLESTKLVIQAHIVAMYLPSLFYGFLFARLGFRGMLWSGVAALLICLLVALLNQQFLNYWLALVLLGIGWNFLFLTATNLLPYGYRREERYRVQSSNDFLVFTVQALVSLGSGWFIFHWRWQGLLWLCALPLLSYAVFLYFQGKLFSHLGTRSENEPGESVHFPVTNE